MRHDDPRGAADSREQHHKPGITRLAMPSQQQGIPCGSRGVTSFVNKRLFHITTGENAVGQPAKCHSRKILENAARHLESSSAFDPRFSIDILLSLLCLFIYPRMIRTALRSTTSFASTSFARPVVARGIARPVLAQAPAQAKRGYHEKVIDHYENPRNVSSLCRRPGTAPSGPVLPMEVPRGIHD